MKPIIIPTILAKDADEALRDIRLINRASSWLHFDILDRTLVPFESWFDPRFLRRWNIRPKIELHLMMDDPATFLNRNARIPNLKRVLWHVEAPTDHAALIKRCRRMDLETGLVINPDTALSVILPFLREVDEVLVMGVVPGKSGQDLLPHTLKTLQALHRLVPRLKLGFDGGVTRKNLRTVIRRGAIRIRVHSLVFNDTHPDRMLRQTNATLKKNA